MECSLDSWTTWSWFCGNWKQTLLVYIITKSCTCSTVRIHQQSLNMHGFFFFGWGVFGLQEPDCYQPIPDRCLWATGRTTRAVIKYVGLLFCTCFVDYCYSNRFIDFLIKHTYIVLTYVLYCLFSGASQVNWRSTVRWVSCRWKRLRRAAHRSGTRDRQVRMLVSLIDR